MWWPIQKWTWSKNTGLKDTILWVVEIVINKNKWEHHNNINVRHFCPVLKIFQRFEQKWNWIDFKHFSVDFIHHIFNGSRYNGVFVIDDVIKNVFSKFVSLHLLLSKWNQLLSQSRCASRCETFFRQISRHWFELESLLCHTSVTGLIYHQFLLFKVNFR